MPTLRILMIVFVATFIRSAFGFGEGLIAVPLLALCIPIKVATPLVALLSITVAGIVLAQDWKRVHFRSTGWLVFSTLLGIPLGLLLLTSGHSTVIKAALALIIIAFSLYSLLGRKPPQLHQDNRGWLLLCGFCAGILGGAYGMNGPPLAVYGTMRRWSAQHFRATLQAYFMPASIIALAGYRLTGLWISAVTHYYLLSIPFVLPAVFLGRLANHRMQEDTFSKYIYAGLVMIGTLLLLEAIRGRPAA